MKGKKGIAAISEVTGKDGEKKQKLKSEVRR
jgi:hypothetical protein